ncbi:MAG: hypothetical protein ACRD2L_12285, partial [Terriglobia bacterium]
MRNTTGTCSRQRRHSLKITLRGPFAVLLSAFLSVAAWAQTSKRDFMPLSELKPGMKGVGRTV